MVILYEKTDRIAFLTLNRPQAMNAINLELARELFEAWRDFVADPQVLVLVVTGAGEQAFCAGADLREAAERGVDSHVLSFWDDSLKLPMRDGECHKPVIAAINGYCLGGGLELALTCDIRIASESATFGQPEIRWGIFPGMGATQRLPRLLPYNLAAEMIFTGEPISARRAFEIGLINQVVASGELKMTVQSLAERISEKPPLALRAAKEALLRSYELPLHQGLRMERLLRRIVGDTDDAREGVKAFAERRKPRFRGR